MPAERLTRDQRREAAREAARIERERAKRRESLTKMIVRTAVTVVVIAVLAGVAWGVYLAVRPAGPGPANMASDGILFTGADGEVSAVETDAIPADGTPTPTDQSDYDVPLHIVTYIDFLCPFCRQFETTNSDAIEELVAAGQATLEVHPISILDAQSLGSRYPSRAANAAACIAAYQPDAFLDASDTFFLNQPAEGTKGLTDDQIIELVRGAGADDPEVASCIRDERFKAWVADATDRALAGPLPNTDVESVDGTPTVLVNGVRYNGALDDPNAFLAFLDEQFVAAGGASAPTPTPTPTP